MIWPINALGTIMKQHLKILLPLLAATTFLGGCPNVKVLQAPPGAPEPKVSLELSSRLQAMPA